MHTDFFQGLSKTVRIISPGYISMCSYIHTSVVPATFEIYVL